MTRIQFNNEASHGEGQCPACGAEVHVVLSPAERRMRWCCTACITVGSAPLEPYGRGAREGADEPSAFST